MAALLVAGQEYGMVGDRGCKDDGKLANGVEYMLIYYFFYLYSLGLKDILVLLSR